MADEGRPEGGNRDSGPVELRLTHLLRTLRAVRDVNQLITREKDRGRLLEQACRRLVAAGGYSGAWIAVLSPKGEPAIVYGAGSTGGLSAHVGQVRSQGLPECGRAALEQPGPVITTDPARTCPDCHLAAGAQGLACLTVRLAHEGTVYGVLGVLLPQRYARDPEEISLLSEMAGDLGFALHAINLKETVREQERKLLAVEGLGRELTLLRDPAGIAAAVVRAARDILGMEDCGLFLVDEENKRLVFAAHTMGEPPGPREFPLEDEQGIMAAVARSGEPICLPDVTKDPRYVPGTLPNRSELCVPLKAGERVLGVLNAESEAPDAFSPEDRTLLATLAGVAAIALENARLFAELRELLEFNQRLVNSMTEGLAVDDAQGRFTYVNPAFAHMVGRTAEELIGRHWTEVVPEDQWSKVKAALKRRRVGETDRYELELLWSDGTRVPALVSGTPRFAQGKFAGTQGIFTDVSALKETERKLRESLVRTDRLLRGAVDAAIAIVEKRDPYVTGHSHRVAKLACAIAGELGLAKERIQGLRMAALLHDVGKIAVPAEILAKPGKLNATEFNLVKQHPQVGIEILKGLEFPWPVQEIIHQHHERLNGTGYPQGLKDGAILLEARILAVADVVEAMSSHRPYRPALGIEAALAEIEREKGRLYDPEVVDVCLRLFRKMSFAWE